MPVAAMITSAAGTEVSTAGRETTRWSALTETLRGGTGNDRITVVSSDFNLLHGDDGNDTLTGGDGGGFMYGGKGDDLLIGGAGSDQLYGEEGNDTLIGAAGDDTLDGGEGHDTFSGGDGIDTGSYQSRTENLNLSLDGVANDGAPGEDENLGPDIENIRGGDGNDLIIGNDLANTLDGSDGTDTIRGLGGDDSISSAMGDVFDQMPSIIDGGAGNDTLQGGVVDYSTRTKNISLTVTSTEFPGNRGVGGQKGEVDQLENIIGVYCGSGNDVVSISDSGERDKEFLINGGAGDDSLSLGGYPSGLIDGGSGNDTLFSSARLQHASRRPRRRRAARGRAPWR